MAIVLAWPTRGPQWVQDKLRRDSLDLAPTPIGRVLPRPGLGTRRERLAALEREGARTGLLTERTV